MLKPLASYLLLIYFFFNILYAYDKDIDLFNLAKLAKKEQKYLLLFFHKKECSFCEKMIEGTLQNPEIVAILKKQFIFIDIGINDLGEIIGDRFEGSKHAYAKSLGINLYPTVGFMNGEGEIVYGVLGYRNSEAFNAVLAYVSGEFFKKMDFETFQNQLDFEKEDE